MYLVPSLLLNRTANVSDFSDVENMVLHLTMWMYAYVGVQRYPHYTTLLLLSENAVMEIITN